MRWSRCIPRPRSAPAECRRAAAHANKSLDRARRLPENGGSAALPSGAAVTDEGEPSYDLLEVQFLVRLGRTWLSSEVRRTTNRDDFDRQSVEHVLQTLKPSDFHKTMPSELDGRTMLDVYRPFRGAQRLYVKFRVESHEGRVFVLSFKKDTSR